MSVFVTSMILLDEDGTALEDDCSLCGARTPWVVSFRFRDFIITACINCCQNIATAAVGVIEERAASKAR